MSVDDFGIGYTGLSQLRTLAGRRDQDRPHLRRRPDRQRAGPGDRRARSSTSATGSAAWSPPRAWRPRTSPTGWPTPAATTRQGYLWLRPAPWTDVAAGHRPRARPAGSGAPSGQDTGMTPLDAADRPAAAARSPRPGAGRRGRGLRADAVLGRPATAPAAHQAALRPGPARPAAGGGAAARRAAGRHRRVVRADVVVRPGRPHHRRHGARPRRRARPGARASGSGSSTPDFTSCSPTWSRRRRIDLGDVGDDRHRRPRARRSTSSTTSTPAPRSSSSAATRPASPTSRTCAGGRSRSRRAPPRWTCSAARSRTAPASRSRCAPTHELGRAGAAAHRAGRRRPQRPAAGRVPGQRPAHHGRTTSSPPRRSTSRASTASPSPRTSSGLRDAVQGACERLLAVGRLRRRARPLEGRRRRASTGSASTPTAEVGRTGPEGLPPRDGGDTGAGAGETLRDRPNWSTPPGRHGAPGVD